MANENPKPVTRHIGLGFMQSGDARHPMEMRLMVQDADWKVEALIVLNEHQFAQLMSGLNITVECEL